MLDPGTEATTPLGRMRAIEAAFADDLRAYVAALAAVAPDSGAACVDMASGVAAFTGEGSPLSTVKGVGPTLLADDVDAVESFAQAHGVPWLPIELAPWTTGEPDALLAARGYHVADHEDVVATTSAGSATTSAGSGRGPTSGRVDRPGPAHRGRRRRRGRSGARDAAGRVVAPRRSGQLRAGRPGGLDRRGPVRALPGGHRAGQRRDAADGPPARRAKRR